ncbi:acyl carrier protein [Phaeovulum sp.]|uniref:acyl carrier protein n=1 Tax=Phaeovulum sp. TaxID=2934796 RepID=UPI00273146C5|nr:acyl carrier protein [Phaeovulum sp.]MDP1669470.1 acyl carrier protein [Phaeovulum sp.]MDP2063464.1 acyl carrier protein [Phaeovulum sp.]MDP3860366.1 acyl carrier protein [Phaeovulum sp.]MDZ4118251.1 acyl carrier protein [Phaeovulum sp.]
MASAVADEIIAIIARQAMLDAREVRLDMTLDELGFDSLVLVEALFAIEEKFDVTVPYNANEPDETDFDISSVGAVIAGVEALVAAKV